jgi:hypothetical protein
MWVLSALYNLGSQFCICRHQGTALTFVALLKGRHQISGTSLAFIFIQSYSATNEDTYTGMKVSSCCDVYFWGVVMLSEVMAK